jgi:hypothetical protein
MRPAVGAKDLRAGICDEFQTIETSRDPADIALDRNGPPSLVAKCTHQ